eukprot:gene7584-biopygen6065
MARDTPPDRISATLRRQRQRRFRQPRGGGGGVTDTTRQFTSGHARTFHCPAADPVAPPRPAERHHPRPPSPAAEDPPPERRPPPTQPSRRTRSTQGCGYTRDPGGRANIKALPAPKAPGK